MRRSYDARPMADSIDHQPASTVLPDGRILSHATYGDPAGLPVLFFHGTPGSHVGAELLHDAALAAGVRLIAPDRPGMGESTYQPGRVLLDWPNDVVALADAMGIDRLRIIGYSGGGPYALRVRPAARSPASTRWSSSAVRRRSIAKRRWSAARPWIDSWCGCRW